MTTPTKILKSVVLVGKFNPPIFQPAWFSCHKLVSDQEGENAVVNIIHPDVVNFKLSWCNVEVTRERVVLNTNQEHAFELIRDLAIGTFRLLSHTPITMLGINFELHMQMRDEDEWHRFGHQLAPKKQFWNDTLINPGTICVTVQGQRPDDYLGRIQVDVRPSEKIKNGVIFRINDHFENESKEGVIGCDYIINILESQWEISHERANSIINNALSKIQS